MNKVSQQQGTALLLALVMLLVLSLLAVSSMQGSLMQEQMASAQREGMMSLEGAESGLRDAELYVESVSALSSFNGSDGLYGLSDDPPDPTDPATWSSNDVREADSVSVGNVSVTPKYFIHHVGEGHTEDEDRDISAGEGYSNESGAFKVEAFRIVAYSAGPSGNAQRVIETYYTRKF